MVGASWPVARVYRNTEYKLKQIAYVNRKAEASQASRNRELSPVDLECRRKRHGKFYEKNSISSRITFAIDTTNNRGWQVSICAALQTIEKVMLQNVWKELDCR
ncbi:hypothetical protein TNCV_2863191 [Trichonephila clavipes]|nr:hypothetical protein TNCV_2863191 [Trichonephila clavipes]